MRSFDYEPEPTTSPELIEKYLQSVPHLPDMRLKYMDEKSLQRGNSVLRLTDLRHNYIGDKFCPMSQGELADVEAVEAAMEFSSTARSKQPSSSPQ